MTSITDTSTSRWPRWPAVRATAALAIAAAVGAAAWIALGRAHQISAPSTVASPTAASAAASSAAASSGTVQPLPARPLAATEAGLQSFAQSLGHPVYWAGSRANVTYELTLTTKGLVYVRYLPAGTKVGDSRPSFLTVGTYPQQDAYAVVQQAASIKGTKTVQLATGGLAVRYGNRPNSVYLASPGSQYLVEVYDPSPAKALALATSGAVTTVG